MRGYTYWKSYRNRIDRKWFMQPLKITGVFRFYGELVLSNSIRKALNNQDINLILMDIKHAVQKNGGIDYLQIFSNRSRKKIYVVDNFRKGIEKSCVYIMFEEEY